jgi:hypothetical protein
MQQEKRRRILRAGLSVEDRETICLRRAIKSRVLHRTFPSLGLGQQLKCTEDHRTTNDRWETCNLVQRGEPNSCISYLRLN